jgi:hypothetical protein
MQRLDDLYGVWARILSFKSQKPLSFWWYGPAPKIVNFVASFLTNFLSAVKLK